MREIAFAGQLTERDFGHINLLAARKTWLVIAGVCLTMLAAFLTFGGWREVLDDPMHALPAFVPFALLGILIYPLHRLTVRRHWRSNKVLQQPVRGAVSDEGIRWEVGELSTMRVPWELLHGYRSGPSLVVVYQGVNQVFYFFRHYF